MKRTLKVIIVGDSCVGKTSLRSRYLQNSFQRAYISTIGTDFVSRTIEVSVPVPRIARGKGKKEDADQAKKTNGGGGAVSMQNGSSSVASDAAAAAPEGEETAAGPSQQVQFEQETVRITLSIWDTAGQERFKSLGSAFYRGADAVIIAFDLSAKGSLARTVNWFNDFCRLGDVAYEEEGMNVKQLKRAREQREQFCWVGVGCKGDLLEELSTTVVDGDINSNSEEDGNDDKKWKGTSWPEARGWFDTMIPRYLPPGEVEKEGYKGLLAQTASTSGHGDSLPYSIGGEVPANPEDVLSRPNRSASISIPGKQKSGGESGGVQPGRPSEAGVAPGLAPSPGSALLSSSKRQPRKSHDDSTKKKGHRKSLRSIEVWQSDQPFASSANSSSASTSTQTEYHRNRYDSTTSAGGASIYYSIRGSSTMLGQSPSGDAIDGGSSDVSSVKTLGRSSTTAGRGQSLSSQDRTRKQSNLSQLADEEEEEGGGTTRPGEAAGTVTTTRSQRTHSSSNTIKGFKEENGKRDSDAAKADEKDSPVDQSDVSAVSTVPSGDPIPFPSSDELDEEYDKDELEVPVRRYSRKMRSSIIIHDDPEEPGNDSGTADLIAEHARQHRLESEEEEAADKRATLYSARPSSISSTIRPADEESSSVGGAAADRLDGEEQDPGSAYQDQMIEQGFRLFFTSAKEGHGIDDVFEHIAKRVAIRWKLEEWQEQREQERQGEGYDSAGVRTAPPTDEEWERERIKRAIKISSGKGTGSCCS